MKNFYFVLFIALLFSNQSVAQVTYAKDVAPIIYDKCSTCHRPGEIGPFPLTSFEDASNRASIIKEVVRTGYMPPWQPNPEYSHFIGEYYLTDAERQSIIDWVDQGAEYGSATDEPTFPDFPEGSLLGEPDAVLEFEQAHIHIGNNRDEYRYFVLPTDFGEDKVIKAIELRPGNSKIVHHALFFQDTEGQAAFYDQQTPEYGFEGYGGFGTDEVLNYDQYPGYVPGTKPLFYPEGLGQVLKAGADLVVQMHYAPWPVDESDLSSVNLFFADEDEEVDRIVDDRIMLPTDLPGGFFGFNIPPNQVKEFHGTWTMTSDISLIGLSPHMHYLGKNWEVWLENPDGSKVNLIQIEEWDFNWQGGYYFKRLIPAMAGSVIHAVATYDNTVDNPSNPSNPPKWVWWGEGTEDEMYYLPILSIPYRDGDENVIFEDEVLSNKNLQDELLSITTYPNPITQGTLTLDFSLLKAQTVDVTILDNNGKQVRKLREGEFFGSGSHRLFYDTDPLPKGIYNVIVQGIDMKVTTSFVKS